MSYKVIESILQMDTGIDSVWNQTTAPVPDKVLAYATNTKILKLGDGDTLYNDLPVFMDLSKAVNSYAFTTKLDPLTAGDASKLIQVSSNGSKFDYTTLVLSDIATVVAKDLALELKAPAIHTHPEYMSSAEASDIITSHTLSSGDEDAIGYLLLQTVAEEDRTAMQLTNGYVDEYNDDDGLDPKKSLFTLSDTHLTLGTVTSSLETYVPTDLTDHTMTKIGNDLYVYGGYSTTLETNQDVLWKFDTTDNYWKSLGQGPYKAKGAQLVSIGTSLYLSGGYDDTDIGNVVYYDKLYKYDTILKTWTELAVMTKKLSHHSMVSYDNNLYIFGGVDETSTLSSSTYKYTTAINEWSTLTSDDSARSHTTASIVGDIVYVYGGKISGDYVNTLRAYEISSNTWSNKTAGGTKRYNTTSTVVGTVMLVLGGYDTDNIDEILEYDTELNTWDTLVPTIGTQYLGKCIGINQLVYYFGGTTADIKSLNIADSTWTTYKTHPGVLENYAATLSGNKWYIHGGQATASISKELWVLDLVECYWTRLHDGLRERYGHTLDVVGNYLYTYGGYLTNSRTDIIDRYDIVNDVWANRTSSTYPQDRHASTVVGTDIYYYGGTVATNTYSATMRVYNTLLDSWSVKESCPVARTGVRMVAVRSKLYTYGGFNIDAKNTLYAYDTVTGAWSALLSGPIPVYSYALTADDEYLYVIGGYNTITQETLLRYNVMSNTWSTLTDIEVPTAYASAAMRLNKIYLYSGNGGGGLISYTRVIATPKYIQAVSQPLPNITTNITGASVLIRDKNGGSPNGTVTVEVSRDNGVTWSAIELDHKKTFNSVIRILGGYCDFTKVLNKYHVSGLDISVQNLKGSVTTFTVDTPNATGHVDSAIASTLVGCKILCDNSHVIRIKSITGDGTADGAIEFAGILPEEVYDVTSIEGIDIYQKDPAPGTVNSLQIQPTVVDVSSTPTYAGIASTCIVEDMGYVSSILGTTLSNAYFTVGGDGSYYIYNSTTDLWTQIIRTVDDVIEYLDVDSSWIATAYTSYQDAITYALVNIEGYRMPYATLMVSPTSKITRTDLSITYIPTNLFVIDNIEVNKLEAAIIPEGQQLKYNVISQNDNSEIHGIRVLWLTE